MSAETVLGHALGPKLGGAGTRRRPDPAPDGPKPLGFEEKRKGGVGWTSPGSLTRIELAMSPV